MSSLARILLTAVAAGSLTACVVRVAEPVNSEPPPAASEAVEVRAESPPPPLPVYEQPPCPGDGWLWTPGYWSWGPAGYYWVPGTWVQPPRVGVYWTPGYWGLVGAAYVWHAGYWGPHVGFYGGVNYGYGYVGTGYVGARWVGNEVHYNQSVTNVNVTNVHNVYNQTVINNVTNVTNVNNVNNTNITRVSYNGGAGGTAAVPTPQERIAEREQHVAPTPIQQQHVSEAARNTALLARSNGGHPPVAATPRPAAFNAPGVIAARRPMDERSQGAAHGNPAGAPPAAGHPGVTPGMAHAQADRPPQAAPASAMNRTDRPGPGAAPAYHPPGLVAGRPPAAMPQAAPRPNTAKAAKPTDKQKDERRGERPEHGERGGR